MANAESAATVSVKVVGAGPDSPDTVPDSACCCSFTFSATSELPFTGVWLSISIRCPVWMVVASKGKFGGAGRPPIPLVSMSPWLTR